MDTGTRVTFVVRADMSGLSRLTDPLLTALAKRHLESDTGNLTDLMEAGEL